MIHVIHVEAWTNTDDRNRERKAKDEREIPGNWKQSDFLSYQGGEQMGLGERLPGICPEWLISFIGWMWRPRGHVSGVNEQAGDLGGHEFCFF